jgi:hypothetical protein
MLTIRARKKLSTSSEPYQSHVHYEEQTAIFTSSLLCGISYAPGVNLITFPVSVPPLVPRCNPSFICGTDRGDRHGCRLHHFARFCNVKYHWYGNNRLTQQLNYIFILNISMDYMFRPTKRPSSGPLLAKTTHEFAVRPKMGSHCLQVNHRKTLKWPT